MEALLSPGVCAVAMASVMAVVLAGDGARARTARRRELARLHAELDQSRVTSHEVRP